MRKVIPFNGMLELGGSDKWQRASWLGKAWPPAPGRL